MGGAVPVTGEVAFMAEIDGLEPQPFATVQSAMAWVEKIETPTGAIYYTLEGAHDPVIVYRAGDIEVPE